MSKATKQTLNITPKDVGHTLVVSESVENGFARSQAVELRRDRRGARPAAGTAVDEKPPDDHRRRRTEPHPHRSRRPLDRRTEELRIPVAPLRKRGPELPPDQRRRTARKYTLVGKDVGKVLELRETATNAAGLGGVGLGRHRHHRARAAGQPESRPASAGHRSRATACASSTANGATNPTEFSYQWERCDGCGNNCEAITGANSRNYAPKSTEVGKTLRVQERAINAAGTSAAATSAATAQVELTPPLNIKPPTVTGNPQKGETLTGPRRNVETHAHPPLRPVAALRTHRMPPDRRRHQNHLRRHARRRRLLDRGQGSGLQQQRMGSGGLGRLLPSAATRRPSSPPWNPPAGRRAAAPR